MVSIGCIQGQAEGHREQLVLIPISEGISQDVCQADMTSLFCFSSLVTWTTTIYCHNSRLTSGVEDKMFYLLQ